MNIFGGTDYNVDFKRLDIQQTYIYERAWNEAIEAAAELMDDEGSGIPAEKIRKLKK